MAKKQDSGLNPETEIILVPIVDAPEMESMLNLLKASCCCGTCGGVGFSWCHAYLPAPQTLPRRT
jgi:hypothetical protein